MNDDRLNEELSAYLDGEAHDAGEIARLLQHDANLARHYAELSSLSAHLKRLPAPEVHPAFATRVLAGARESSAPAYDHRLRYWVTAGVAAAVLLVVAVTVLRDAPEPAYDPGVVAVLELRHGGVNELGPIGTLMDQDILTAPALPEPEPADLADAPSVDSMEVALASMVWLASEDEERNEQQDLDSMLGSLNEAEIAVLKELLVEYATQGDTI